MCVASVCDHVIVESPNRTPAGAVRLFGDVPFPSHNPMQFYGSVYIARIGKYNIITTLLHQHGTSFCAFDALTIDVRVRMSFKERMKIKARVS